MVSGYGNLLAIVYHDIFDYPLTAKELRLWKSGKKIQNNRNKFCKKKTGITKINFVKKDGYFFIKGREEIIKKRIKNEKYSKKKLNIARKASKLISKIPTVVFVGITGALAMKNASENSDIDLLIIAKKDSLWTTRILVYLILLVFGFKIRSPLNKNEKDKLCLNMWLDENDLIWSKSDRNIYTAHEITQIVPLVNKNKIYEKFLLENKWILGYWPKIVKITKKPKKWNIKEEKQHLICPILNFFSFQLQYLYMKSKITREVITPTRAIFHPTDWGKKVLTRLDSFG